MKPKFNLKFLIQILNRAEGRGLGVYCAAVTSCIMANQKKDRMETNSTRLSS